MKKPPIGFFERRLPQASGLRQPLSLFGASDAEWIIKDSNLGPTGYEPVALTAELMIRVSVDSDHNIIAQTGVFVKSFLKIRKESDEKAEKARTLP